MAAWAISDVFGFHLTTKAVGFLLHASGTEVGAHMLRIIDAQSALLPISFLPDDAHRTSNTALMCLINVLGNREAAHGQDSPIMVVRPDVVAVGNAAQARCFIRCFAQTDRCVFQSSRNSTNCSTQPGAI